MPEATNNVTVIETQFMWFLQLRNLTKAYAQRPKHLGPRLDSHPWREIEEWEKEFVTGEKERSRPAMVVERRGGWQPPKRDDTFQK
jgi:hypothetical protein